MSSEASEAGVDVPAVNAEFDDVLRILRTPGRQPGRMTADATDVAEAFLLFGRAYAERPEWSRWCVERAFFEGRSIQRGEGLLTLIEKVIELSREQKDRGRLRVAMLLFLLAEGLAVKAKEMT